MVEGMAKKDKKIVGNTEGLRIEVSWDCEISDTEITANKATIGSLYLWVGDELVWGNIENEKNIADPVNWTWVELLEFLSNSWLYILHEEIYPFYITPQYPSELRGLAAQRWQNMPEDISIKEEREIYDFESSHDISRGLNGILLPSVFFMREGNYMWIETPEFRILRPFEETVHTLEEFGNIVCERIDCLSDPHAKWVRSCWNKRKDVDNEELFSITTKLSPQDIRDIQGDRTFKAAWDCDNDIDCFALTELPVAARMASGISDNTNIRHILDEIRAVGHFETPQLDKLSCQALACLNENMTKRFYEQGYILADWLRRQSGIISKDGKVDPEELLANWRVLINEIELNEPSIDAVACWGPNHGPAILLNGKGIHNKKISGKRATYAHEVCHLLVDRKGFLPLAEVLGGNTPNGAERRANAFAAELLLPRSIVAQYINNNQEKTIKSICRKLSSKFGVSFHLIANQILNSNVDLGYNDHKYLRRFRVV